MAAGKDFLPQAGGASRQSSAAAAKREKFYQAVIWLLVIWNICLQARSLSRAASMSSVSVMASGDVHVGIERYSELMASENPGLTGGSFTDPVHTPETFGAAGVVCSGCSNTTTDGSDLSHGPSGVNATSAQATAAQTGNASASTDAVAAGSSSSRNGGAPADFGPLGAEVAASVGAASVGGASVASVSLPSPLEAATLAAGAVAAEKMAAGVATGRGRQVIVPFVPPPPIPAGLAEGAACTSAFKGDSREAQCLTFCIGKFARAHCARCKCRSCSFCPRDPAASSAGTSAGASAANASSAPSGAAIVSIDATSPTSAAAGGAPAAAANGVP